MSPDPSHGDSSAPPRRRPRLIDISTLTAVAGLAVALVFNALQVRDSAKQERETRQATQLELLTELNGLVTPFQTKVVPLSPEFRRAEDGNGSLSNSTNANFAATLTNLNYLAWLFDNGYVAIPAARQLWSPEMECADATALLVYGPRARARLSALDRFVHPGSHKALLRLRDATC